MSGFWTCLLRTLLLILLYGSLAGLACGQILQLDGYPYNQNALNFFQQVEVFRLAIATGKVLPWWNPFAQQGAGAWFPFMYPRVYGNLVGLLAYLLNSTLWAVKLSIPTGLTIGAIGMHQTAHAVGLKPSFCVCGATLLIFANGTYNDWLLRGDLSGFWMAMLLPWLCYCLLQWFQKRRLSVISLGLLFTIFLWGDWAIFYGAMILFITWIVCVEGRSLFLGEKSSSLYQDLAIGIGIFGTIVGLNWLIFHSLEITTQVPHVTLEYGNFYRPPLGYLVDTVFNWQYGWERISVEVGRSITIPLLVLLLIMGLLVRAQDYNLRHLLQALNIRFLFLCITLTFCYIQYDWFRPLYPEQYWIIVAYFCCTISLVVLTLFRQNKDTSPVSHREVIIHFLSLSLTVLVYLQLPISLWVYLWVPGAAAWQFPWRILSLITPLTILFLCERLDLLSSLETKLTLANVYRGILLIIVVVQINFGIRIQDIQYEVYGSDVIRVALQPTQLITQPAFQFLEQ